MQGITQSDYDSFQKRYFSDPAGFAVDCIEWGKSRGPAPYQLEILDMLVKEKRVSVRAPHGAGKSCIAAIAILWFALTRDVKHDWKIPTTASAWRQLTKYLWPEIHKWSRLLKYEKIGRDPINQQRELLTINMRLKTGEAFAVASDDSNTIEGAHASQILYVFDEAKIIAPNTWDSAEGAMTTANAFWLSISTPGEPFGRFYDIQIGKKEYADWSVRHVTLAESISAKRIDTEWALARRRQWGETSAIYLNRVEGEFATSAAESVIPISWIEQAQDRWEEQKPHSVVVQIGCDVARMGDDKNVIALRSGYYIHELIKDLKTMTTEVSGKLKGLLRMHPDASAIIDIIGIGSGVYDSVVEEYPNRTYYYHAQTKTDKKDITGLWEFDSTYSAIWYNLRDMLDPNNNFPVALPPDDDLAEELSAPKWKVLQSGKIQVESKDKIKETLGHSPDCAEAVAMAFWELGGGGMDAA